MVDLMCSEHQVSLRQGCKAVNLPRSSYSYKRKPKNDQMIIDALLELTSKHPAIGFWQSYYRIRLMGHRWNHKRVYRVYTTLKNNIWRNAKKRLPARAKQQLFQPKTAKQVWSLDYMHYRLWDEQSERLPNVIYDYNRKVLHIETDTRLPALQVIRVLSQPKETRELPQMIRVDNRPEFISKKLDNWCKDNQVTLAFIQPGKPTQNAYVERLNGSIRSELLNAYIFKTLDEVRDRKSVV